MTEEPKRPLKVFLCHASGDKPAVRDLYKRLVEEGVDAWLDQEKIMPGQDWRVEIPRAVRESDVVVVCLSNKSITKEGYVQREIKFALDQAEEKPEGTIFLIPARLEDCVVPEGLDRWQWVDLFEENGFLRLLRSLKLRADRVGAIIEHVSYEGDNREVDKRLEQFYTDGLAAFYTEDWDRACLRFQAILRERPNHKIAAEKLAQAERQRNFAKLYAQATGAYKSENWLVAIQTLEELLGKSGDYKDAVQLLQDAKKHKQLKELYAEAKTLHTAEKWQAVVRVFERISAIEPTYPDPEGLLTSALKEVAELKRLEELNELYSHGVRQMDAGNWYEARKLLEQVHKMQTGFLETERLLRKVEDEIRKIEELQQRNIQINTLYEQAHGLLRSKNWREALDKIDEIQKLDNKFEDKDGIAEEAKTALELEEQEIQKQNQLAAMYAEAVRLLRDGKYQEALDKWQEVKAIDPKYPDRQSVQRIAHKKLAARRPRIANLKQLGIISFLIVTLVGIVWLSSQAFDVPNNVLTVTTSPMPFSPPSEYYWHFSNDSEDWRVDANDISFASSGEGFLKFKTTGGNPYINSPSSLKISASMTPILTVRMSIKGTNSLRGAIFFTDKDNVFDEKKYESFDLIHGGGAFHTYDIDMSQTPTWQGVINQIQLHPLDEPEPANDVQITIDYIWVHKR